MILTQKEFVSKEKVKISAIELAFLIKTGALSTPFVARTKSGVKKYLFDEIHINEIEAIIEKKEERCPSDWTNKQVLWEEQFGLITAGYSNDIRRILAPHHNVDKESEKYPEPKNIEDVFSRHLPWHKRAFRYATTFRWHNVKISGNEQVDLIISQAISTTQVPSKIVSFVAPRIRKFDGEKPFDQCLKHYIDNQSWLGWNNLEYEIGTIEEFIKYEKRLLKWSIAESLSFLGRIQSEYEAVYELAFQYVEVNDPENLILKHVVYTTIFPKIMKILKGAVDRTQREFAELFPDGDKIAEELLNPVKELLLNTT